MCGEDVGNNYRSSISNPTSRKQQFRKKYAENYTLSTFLKICLAHSYLKTLRLTKSLKSGCNFVTLFLAEKEKVPLTVVTSTYIYVKCYNGYIFEVKCCIDLIHKIQWCWLVMMKCKN